MAAGGDRDGIGLDPPFVGPLDGDFHLQAFSPCVDSRSSDWPATLRDLDGEPRVDDPEMSNDGEGLIDHYDIGADGTGFSVSSKVVLGDWRALVGFRPVATSPLINWMTKTQLRISQFPSSRSRRSFLSPRSPGFTPQPQ